MKEHEITSSLTLHNIYYAPQALEASHNCSIESSIEERSAAGNPPSTADLSFSPTDELPDDALAYYAQTECDVIAGLSGGLDPVLSEITLKVFVSGSKGSGRKRSHPKEIQLIKYGHSYHLPHKFDWWIAGQEILGQVEDVETKIREIVLGNQAYNMNSQRRGYLS